jgi:hypothetical protein
VLKISVIETKTELRWMLEGRLAGPWVMELRTSWANSEAERAARALWILTVSSRSIKPGKSRCAVCSNEVLNSPVLPFSWETCCND